MALYRRNDYIVKSLYSSFVFVSILSAIAATAGMLIDNIIAGQFLGQDALGAMGIVGPIGIVFSAVGNICSGGGTTLASQAVGRGDKEEVRNIFTVTLLFALISGLVITLPGLLFPRQLAVLLGAKDELLDLSADYIRGFFLGTIPTIMTTALMGFVKIDGSPKLPLCSIAAMSVGDVILDIVMVTVFKLGMFGMALATTLSYMIAVLVACLHFVGKKNTLKLVKPQSPWKILGTMTITGAPASVGRICDTLKSVILNNIMVTAIGVGAVAALNVRNQANNIFGALTLGVGQAIVPVAGMFHGEEDRTALRSTLKTSIKIGLIINCIAAVVLAVFPRFLPKILGITEAAVMDMAVAAVLMFAISMPFRAINNTYLSFCQATKKVGMALLICVLESFVYTVLSALLLIKPMGSNGVWLAFIIGEVLTLLTVYLIIAIQKKKTILSLDDLMLIKEPFGPDEKDILEFSIANDQNKVQEVSEKFFEYATVHKENEKLLKDIALFVEEIAGNIVQHSFKAGKKCWLDVTIVNKHDSMLLQFRDNGAPFDPLAYLNAAPDTDKERNVGLRLVRGIADEFVYRRSMGLNVLQITIRAPA